MKQTEPDPIRAIQDTLHNLRAELEDSRANQVSRWNLDYIARWHADLQAQLDRLKAAQTTGQ